MLFLLIPINYNLKINALELKFRRKSQQLISFRRNFFILVKKSFITFQEFHKNSDLNQFSCYENLKKYLTYYLLSYNDFDFNLNKQ